MKRKSSPVKNSRIHTNNFKSVRPNALIANAKNAAGGNKKYK